MRILAPRRSLALRWCFLKIFESLALPFLSLTLLDLNGQPLPLQVTLSLARFVTLERLRVVTRVARPVKRNEKRIVASTESNGAENPLQSSSTLLPATSAVPGTQNELAAGVGCTLPTRSMARTLKVCLPSVRVGVVHGEEHAPKEPLSRLHWNFEPPSFELKPNVPLWPLVDPGPEAIAAFGASVSSARVTKRPLGTSVSTTLRLL